ncbi:MAG: hypothetical protein WC515_02900 [Candidatus Omnitrophota bacterium]
MIKLDISALIFFYMLSSAVIILIVWAVSGERKRGRSAGKEAGYIWKCSVCFHNYIDSKHEDISLCPVCGSYNKKEGVDV